MNNQFSFNNTVVEVISIDDRAEVAEGTKRARDIATAGSGNVWAQTAWAFREVVDSVEAAKELQKQEQEHYIGKYNAAKWSGCPNKGVQAPAYSTIVRCIKHGVDYILRDSEGNAIGVRPKTECEKECKNDEQYLAQIRQAAKAAAKNGLGYEAIIEAAKEGFVEAGE